MLPQLLKYIYNYNPEKWALQSAQLTPTGHHPLATECRPANSKRNLVIKNMSLH